MSLWMDVCFCDCDGVAIMCVCVTVLIDVALCLTRAASWGVLALYHHYVLEYVLALNRLAAVCHL